MEFEIWDLNELDDLNRDYEISTYHKGYFAIGSNGVGEMLAVELDTSMVYIIPFISGDSIDRIKVADSLSALKR